MVGLMEMLASKRRFFVVGLLLIVDLFLLSLLSSAAQGHADAARTSHSAKAASLTSSDPAFDSSDNAVTVAFTAIGKDAAQAAMSVGSQASDFPDSIATDLNHGGKAVGKGIGNAASATGHGLGVGAGAVAHGIGGTFAFCGGTIWHGFALMGRGVGDTFGFFGHVSHVSSVIRPKDDTPIPTIAQMRIEQTAIIQNGTKAVVVSAPKSGNGTAVFHPIAGVGGACDAGSGNGGYPMAWCDAPMDSVRTIGYSGDAINRECTSYAYWFFTSIEGHADFHVTGNAKYWAYTSNYPVHATPAVGAIAVETGGYYGHVSIVQALPGQSFDHTKVPAGYILVSEMNYDWAGHFRYSFVPIGKPAAFIYR